MMKAVTKDQFEYIDDNPNRLRHIPTGSTFGKGNELNLWPDYGELGDYRDSDLHRVALQIFNEGFK